MHLAIDTSTDIAGIAIADELNILSELTWNCGQNHSVQLMPRITQLMGKAEIKFEQLNGVVVAIGPGSFNGLRVGVSTAKGIAYGLGIPLVGISTLEVTAYGYGFSDLPICPIINAGRTEVAAALFRQIDGDWQKLTAEHITTIPELCEQTNSKTLFCGELKPAAIEELIQKLGDKALIPSPAVRLRRPGLLAELGYRKLESGNYDDAASLQPIYLKKPPITQHKNMTPQAESEL
ncbi:MAG: tRNA (adenosine(37)-N6)-threonylcarbamoyltransferase complex dimerization subunit type 1 TsaB [Dehalococcoidales bacterium]